MGKRERNESGPAGELERLRRITAVVADYIYTVRVEDARAVETVHGPACITVTGYSSDEFAADPYLWLRMVHDEDRDAVIAHAQRILTGESAHPLEHRIVRKDGVLRWVLNTPVPHTDSSGRLTAYDGLIHDITDRKGSEAALRESETRLRLTLEATQDAVWDWDVPAEKVFWSPRIYKVLGLDPETVQPTPALWHSLIHPDDLPAVLRAMEAHLSGDVPLYQAEYRIRSSAGAWLWVHSRGRVVERDDAGRPLRMTGSDRNIDERKHAEAALRLSYFAVDRASESAFWITPDAHFHYVNDAACRALEYTREELIGMTVYDVDPDTPPALWRAVWEDLKAKGAMLIESRHRSKSGRVFPVEISINYWSGDDQEYNFAFARDITERRKAEAVMRETNQTLAAIIEASPVAIMSLDTEGRVRTWNASAERLFGWTEAEAVGQAPPFVPSESETQFRRIFAEVLAGEAVFGLELIRKKKDGSEILISLSAAPLREESGRVGGIVALIQDVTDRRRAEDAMRESEAKYKALFENSTDGILLMTHEVRECNEQACRILGCDRWELIGRSPVDFSPPKQPDGRDSAQAAAEYIEAALEGRPQRFYWRHEARDGREVDAEVALKVLVVSGETLLLAVMRDITEQRRAEQDRRSLEAQVQHAQKLESLGVLAGGIAHDFNNLLMAILGNADLALAELAPAAPARASLSEIEKAARRAAELCRQMLAYSGKGQFVVEALNLSEVVAEMAHMLEISISKKAVLKYRFAPELPAIEGDATQIRQVIMNLIINASEAIGDRSGVISVTTGVMHCDAAYLAETYLDDGLAESDYVYIEVADTGSGMDAETRKRIFDPFFTTKFTGRGLGLAAVLGIVRGHTGAIKVYSESGRGTTFKVLFPAVADGAAAVSGGPAPAEHAWTCGETVLLADDEETLRMLGKRMLERIGCNVLTAADGREAVEVYMRHADEIACVILDLTMPHLDGAEAFRELRRLRPGVRVILCSGYNEQEVTEQFAGKGLAGFIHKPYTLASLRTVLKHALEPEP